MAQRHFHEFGTTREQLGMIPMLTLIAVHAPPGRQATWFALVASLMNPALQAGNVISRGLNAAFPVERGDYAELPALMVAVSLTICRWHELFSSVLQRAPQTRKSLARLLSLT